MQFRKYLKDTVR